MKNESQLLFCKKQGELHQRNKLGGSVPLFFCVLAISASMSAIFCSVVMLMFSLWAVKSLGAGSRELEAPQFSFKFQQPTSFNIFH
jgi:hypothetical protein